jgi:hypothetical protein
MVETRFESSTTSQRIHNNDKEQREAIDQRAVKPKPTGNLIKKWTWAVLSNFKSYRIIAFGPYE